MLKITFIKNQLFRWLKKIECTVKMFKCCSEHHERAIFFKIYVPSKENQIKRNKKLNINRNIKIHWTRLDNPVYYCTYRWSWRVLYTFLMNFILFGFYYFYLFHRGYSIILQIIPYYIPTYASTSVLIISSFT